MYFGVGSWDETRPGCTGDKLLIERKGTRSELIVFLRKKQYPQGRIILGVR